mmetsp:Transcript_17852/g.25110  ORF Transcript_17852/g.25110 Transcript_17852/m.25110 type:complete len:206 (-) Transcript_17852:45-662(-)
MIMSNYFANDDEKLVRSLFHQIVEGVEYLHNKDIAHMDMKPENILLGEDGKLKVTDFDSSVFVDKERVVSKVGTRNYRAPECINCNAKDLFAADIYSLGVILFVLKAGIFPYAEDMKIQGNDLFSMVLNGEQKFWELHPKTSEELEEYSADFRNLFMTMCNEDPKVRPTLEEVKLSAWYNGPTYSQEKTAALMMDTVRKVRGDKK